MGVTGSKHTEETKAKMAKARRIFWENNPEKRKANSERLRELWSDPLMRDQRKKSMILTSLEEKFWLCVDKKEAGCWAWTGLKSVDGYGELSHKCLTYRAHRVSWALHFGEIPNKMSVLHKCDNRECTNPDHLFIGTQLDNMRDCAAKGRISVLMGESNPSAKINQFIAEEIRLIHSSGSTSISKIASMYGIGRTTVRRILNYESWNNKQREKAI
jgi:hypothetical protein